MPAARFEASHARQAHRVAASQALEGLATRRPTFASSRTA